MSDKYVKVSVGLLVVAGKLPVEIVCPGYDTEDFAPREAEAVRDYFLRLCAAAHRSKPGLVAVPWGWLQDAARLLTPVEQEQSA